MVRSLFLLGIIIIQLTSSCQFNPQESARSYFPSRKNLRDGIIHKYYFNYQDLNITERWTDITYYEYQSRSDSLIVFNTYNPGLEQTSKSLYLLDGPAIYLKTFEAYWYGDTIEAQVDTTPLFHLSQDSVRLVRSSVYPGDIRETVEFLQTAVKDTLILNKPAKKLSYRQFTTYEYPDSTTREQLFINDQYYVKGMGVFERDMQFEDGTGTLVLIQQMGGKAFKHLVTNRPKRIAYIDNTQRLDKDRSFQLCEPVDRIVDYYNGTPDASYITGKKGLYSAIIQALDPELLESESGYLTYRFVINCRGEIGWFITEEADLDYQLKSFSPALVQHLYEIISNLEDWQPTKSRDQQVRDAYAYLTIKLKNGEIIDLLP